MGEAFAARFAAARSRWGPLVWGLDPSGALLDAWGFGDSADGLDRFADVMLAAAVGTVGLVKPQSAFYERHGWRGIATLQRLVADARSACLLVVTRSSNPEGRAVQAARGDGGHTVEETLLRDIGALNATLAPGALFLAPGVGAQGATCADVARTFAGCPDRVMPSASRSLLSAGPDPSALRDTAAKLAAELRSALPAQSLAS